MQDMAISGRVISYALWVIGVGLIVASFFGPIQLAHFGLLLAGVGGVLQIRGYICGLHQRELDAYQLGQESVRPIR